MKNFQKKYNRLNEEQKRAVDNIDGPLMIVAGPGSGKTELLSVRAANIIKKKDIPASSLLCLTFTDAAALNMKERLVELIGEDGYKIPTMTFHSFCKDIIDDNPEYFYKGADFDLADEVTKTEIIEEILKKMDYDNPLSSKHSKMGYVYLYDIKRAISDLKEGGVTPDEFKEILKANQELLAKINPLVRDVFSQRVSKSIIPEVEKLLTELKEVKVDFPGSQFKPLTKKIIDSLEVALEGDGTKKITAWKNKWTKKKGSENILRDQFYLEKQKSLASVYSKYENEMFQRGLYDFSDMILDVIKELERNDSLRYDLEEKYLYIMVDEFQDTSGVQMRLLKNITKDEPHDQPNICVVGDDDQAIYRFQGAEISNILNFKDSYSQVEIITLKKNYRSAQKIIDMAGDLISKGEERLERKIEEVDKNLIAADKKKSAEIKAKRFKTKQEEYSHVADKVNDLIKNGVNPEEIAVMGRKHKILKEIAPYFQDKGIPVYAERKVNVLENEVVIQIIKILRFCNTLLDGDKSKAEEFLPEILSYPFWEIDRDKVWKVARKSYKNRSSWLEEMQGDKDLSVIADFLIDISKKSKYKPVEEIIDLIIGNKKGEILSPLKSHYFSKEALKKDSTKYFKFLSALKRFTGALKKYKSGQFLKTEDLLEFVDRHNDNNISINDNSPLITDSNAVSLITSHSAKGREFEAVFVLSCQHEIWGKKGRASKISFPSNTPLERSGETRDDQLRLFYVTLTRAKKFLSLTSHKKKENGKSYTPLEFIDHFDPKEEAVKVTYQELESSRKGYYSPPFEVKEKQLLKPLADEYMLSATGFNKYLNVFDEGPQTFLEDTLLRFPSKKHLAASYGTAIHKTVNFIYNQLKETGKLPVESKVLETFEKYLQKERLGKTDFKKYLKRGKDSLKAFYQEKKEEFRAEDLTEKNFRNQGVVINQVKLTGKIDKIRKEKNKIEVVDFKTGKPLAKWNKGSKYSKLKSWKYKNQLIFYKLLIENSRDFSNCQVERGYLEFIEPDKEKNIITLPLEIKKEETQRVKKLIEIVGKRIKNLNFSIEKEYPKNKVKSIKEFEEDLLSQYK